MLLSLLFLLPVLQDAQQPSAPSTQGPATPAPATQAAAPQTWTPLVSLTTRGCESFFVDAKDERLLRALQLIDERLLELPDEIPGFDAPPGALELALRLLSSPMALSAARSSREVEGMPFPVAGELRLTQTSDADAAGLLEDIAFFMNDMGASLGPMTANGAHALDAPFPLWLGELGADVFLRVGPESGVPAASQSSLLPAGAKLAFAASFNLGGILDLASEAMGGDAEMEEMQRMLSIMGMNQLAYDMAFGSDDERSYFMLHMPGGAAAARTSGLLPGSELPTKAVATIPEDATWAVAFSLNLRGIADLYRDLFKQMSGDENFDLFAMIEEQTGLNVEADLLTPFGNSGAIYASDSTGGGGMLSTVAVLELADREAFLRTWGEFEEAAAQFGSENLGGYMRFSHWDQAGHDYSILSFPGLPIPLEICMTTTPGYAVLGLTPQAAQAAVWQIEQGQRSLLNNPDFQAQLAPDISGLTSVTWINTPRLMQDGYGTVSLLCSALANGVRSSRDATREPGLLLPPFNVLRQGAKGMVSVSRIVGEDMLSETRADRSQLVNAVGLTGYMYASPMLALVSVGVLSGIVVPQMMSQLGQVQDESEPFQFELMEEEPAYEGEVDGGEEMGDEEPLSEEEQRAVDDVMAIYAALEMYAANNGGLYPDSLKPLVELDANGERYLDPAHLVDPWGDEYLYYAPEGDRDYPVVEFAD